MIPVLNPRRRWECPSCGRLEETVDSRPHTPMHPCPALRGLLAPFVPWRPSGPSERHVVQERDDYVGKEVGVRFDGAGRAITAVLTERPDGSNDAVVFPATATNRD